MKFSNNSKKLKSYYGREILAKGYFVNMAGQSKRYQNMARYQGKESEYIKLKEDHELQPF